MQHRKLHNKPYTLPSFYLLGGVFLFCTLSPVHFMVNHSQFFDELLEPVDDQPDIYIGEITTKEALGIIDAAHKSNSNSLSRVHHQIVEGIALKVSSLKQSSNKDKQRLAEYAEHEAKWKAKLDKALKKHEDEYSPLNEDTENEWPTWIRRSS